MNKNEKLVSVTGSVAGSTSVLGSWQVCHSICLGIVWLLGIVGITVSGMPLFFLTKIAIPIWIVAVGIFAVTFSLYFFKRCISKTLLLFNAGVLLAGVPFPQVSGARFLFWIGGGALVFWAGILFLQKKLLRRKNHGQS